MFRDLSALVIDQGSVLDRIDYNMEQMVQKGVKTNAQLQKSHKTKRQNDSRAFKCMILLVVINVLFLLILLVKYKMKYGWSFGNMFWFLFFTVAAAGGAYYIVRYNPQICHMMCPRA